MSFFVFHCKACTSDDRCERHELGFVESDKFDKYIEEMRAYEKTRITAGYSKETITKFNEVKKKAKRAWKRAYHKRLRAEAVPHDSDLMERSKLPPDACEQKTPKWLH